MNIRLSRTTAVNLISLLLFFAGTVASAKTDWVDGEVEKISDGDTLWVQVDRKVSDELSATRWLIGRFLDDGPETRLKIRTIGIDAPETHLPTPNHGVVGQGHYGDKATDMMTRLVPVGTKVVVEDQGLDKYKRTLGRIWRGNDDINLAMVRYGWAVTYIICEGSKCNANYLKEERAADYVAGCWEAKQAGRGIWDPNDPLREMPFEFRLRMQERDPDKLVGDFRTRRLYAPEDYKKVEPCDRIFFMSEAGANRAGFHR